MIEEMPADEKSPLIVSDGLDPEAELKNLPESLVWEYRPVEGSDELVVTLSPSRTFLMSQTKFARNTLLMTDKKGSYYTFKASYVVKVLVEFITRHGFKKVLFVGSSKGAFGAMLYAGHCAKRDRRRPYYCLAYSPQVSLYPPNPHLADLPSYGGLLSRLSKDQGLRISVERSPDAHLVEWVRNLHVVIVYSELYEQDVKEQARLCAPNIRKYPVPFTLHASIMPFNMRGFEEDDVRQRVRLMYRTKNADADLAATLPEEWGDLVAWITGNKWVPSVLGLIDEMMSVEVDLCGLPPLRPKAA